MNNICWKRERLYFNLECIFSKKKIQSHSLFNKVIVRDIEKKYHNFNTKWYYISKLMESNDGNSKLIFKIFTSIFQ